MISNVAANEPAANHDSAPGKDISVDKIPFLTMYQTAPVVDVSLFDLEVLVVRRMELLAAIDSKANAPDLVSRERLVKNVSEMVRRDTDRMMRGQTRDLATLDEGFLESQFSLTATEDDVSHHACRLVFCQSDQWREWFLRNEELLLRGRLDVLYTRRGPTLLDSLLAINSVDCAPVEPGAVTDEQAAWLAKKDHESGGGALYSTSVFNSLRAVKTRRTICVGGRAVVSVKFAREAVFSDYRRKLQRGLGASKMHRARIARQPVGEAEAEKRVTEMLDTFFKHFIVDPADAARPTVEGALGVGDIPAVAAAHYPLCMRRADRHLRQEGHMKHNSRWMYGLFLKAIGLSMEDSIALFGQLMTLKGGGPEKFAKSAYAYNIRHAFGKEGKRQEYSSLTCQSVFNQGPTVDKHDCHGCPFRFQHEADLRRQLQEQRPNPRGGMRAPTPADIEDIVSDAKGKHYTRACFRYFRATHPGFRRETLFRSPFEYYQSSVVFGEDVEGALPSGKRPLDGSP